MQNKIIMFPIALLIVAVLTSLTLPKPYKAYCDKWKLTAQMLDSVYGVPPSIQFAQAIIESGCGRSYIARNSRNHFGIRYYAGTTDKEAFYDRGNGAWRCYETVSEGYIDHAKFLNQHYKGACFKGWGAWAGLEGYGGAGYWQEVNKVIRKYKLYKYD